MDNSNEMNDSLMTKKTDEFLVVVFCFEKKLFSASNAISAIKMY